MTEIIYIQIDKKEELLKIADNYGQTGQFSLILNMTRSGLKVTIEGDKLEIKTFIEELRNNSIV